MRNMETRASPGRGHLLTPLDAILRRRLYVAAVGIHRRVQLKELLSRGLVREGQLRVGVVVDVLARRGVIPAYDVADISLPLMRLAIVCTHQRQTSQTKKKKER